MTLSCMLIIMSELQQDGLGLAGDSIYMFQDIHQSIAINYSMYVCSSTICVCVSLLLMPHKKRYRNRLLAWPIHMVAIWCSCIRFMICSDHTS